MAIHELINQRTYGRSMYFAGRMLEDCTTPGQRAGYVGAEADCRRAMLQARLAVSLEEWRFNPGVLDGEDWEL